MDPITLVLMAGAAIIALRNGSDNNNPSSGNSGTLRYK